MADKSGKRRNNKPWKGIYGKDRAYTARVDAARERGQYTASKAELAAEPRPPRAWSINMGPRAVPVVGRVNW